ISRKDPSSRASISTLDRIGIVFLRSTTDWTWLRLLRRVARSIVAFMSPQPHQPPGTSNCYSEPIGARKWNDAQSFIWGIKPQRPQYMGAYRPRLWPTAGPVAGLLGMSSTSTW